ncbi:MAG: SLBB domain-containing protein [Treponema sp.]|jgi:electron transport complex protein RnfC|nr:SLBB domain-containing protein [Treponema sp.]
MNKYSFPKGGLPYYDSTAPSKTNVVNAFLPALSVIPLGNSMKKVYPIVSQGEQVREGMLIGRASGAGAANVHATVPGRITRKVSWKDGDNIEHDAFVIKLEGAFEKLGKRSELFQWKGVSAYDLQRIFSDHGIVEMENTEKPLAEMVSAGRKKDKLALVVRCVIDDPWLVADYALCQERIKDVVIGAAIVAKACVKVKQIIFAVSYREKELGQKLLESAEDLDIPTSLVLTGYRYPQRNSRELEMALRIYEKKENLNLGSFLILGPAVLVAAYDAVVHNKPVLERFVAVGGTALKQAQIMRIRIGTRIGDVIEQCGGFTGKLERIITGSPLSGREVIHLDEPVTKSCYAIVAMTKTQTANHGQQSCINCGECRVVCPVGLDPQYIYKRLKKNIVDNAWRTSCHGCGCCKIVCPSALPLSETILDKKQEALRA